ncbi:FAD binding domain-containing protein [Paractinoplanes lichenicola]|uniref:FAD binding domain-containing protein n=1 Tax=Paractinoplanes lichenicola TaxID=2802976 RepID=A0ABS1W002_9ACTN|nr:FAD binding domain-containing protein [Actinoplanes lichenicola]MBL7260061.1 FAD binding domain-containing protein [Actinoplanes lichenicola]
MEYIVVREPEEVLAALADGTTSVLAGGQSLVPDMVDGLVRPGRLVDINQVTEFDRLTQIDGTLRVGPLVRHRTFESERVGGGLGLLLRTVVGYIGHPPVRARGTMLGSLTYAHPAAEWPAMATILGARFELAGPDGCRSVLAEQFYTGPFETVRRPEELLAEVSLPVLPAGTGAGFAEQRPGNARYAEVAAMAAVTMADGLVTGALIGLVNAGPCPVRARTAEQVLLGTGFADADVRAAAEAAATEDATLLHHPAADRPGHRRNLERLTRRALTQARETLT